MRSLKNVLDEAWSELPSDVRDVLTPRADGLTKRVYAQVVAPLMYPTPSFVRLSTKYSLRPGARGVVDLPHLSVNRQDAQQVLRDFRELRDLLCRVAQCYRALWDAVLAVGEKPRNMSESLLTKARTMAEEPVALDIGSVTALWAQQRRNGLNVDLLRETWADNETVRLIEAEITKSWRPEEWPVNTDRRFKALEVLATTWNSPEWNEEFSNLTKMTDHWSPLLWDPHGYGLSRHPNESQRKPEVGTSHLEPRVAPLDRTVYRRLHPLLRRGDQQSLTLQLSEAGYDAKDVALAGAAQACQPLGVHSPEVRTALAFGAVFVAVLLDPREDTRQGLTPLKVWIEGKSSSARAVASALRQRWRDEKYLDVQRTLDDFQAFIWRLWPKLHRLDFSSHLCGDPEVIDGPTVMKYVGQAVGEFYHDQAELLKEGHPRTVHIEDNSGDDMPELLRSSSPEHLKKLRQALTDGHEEAARSAYDAMLTEGDSAAWPSFARLWRLAGGG